MTHLRSVTESKTPQELCLHVTVLITGVLRCSHASSANEMHVVFVCLCRKSPPNSLSSNMMSLASEWTLTVMLTHALHIWAQWLHYVLTFCACHVISAL